ncbi:branched-chain amino acid aminotransferase [Pedococcus cremeus]|uniref:Branched-chain amino acid aminotransferase n=1 Tax=Pedococcus cremeus TaxID=587636 RepID=A0A1H9TS98_9MICO|nr:aminotransferase class IV [Pedococcus cremeus]SER99904.1 branched-chain amino acid aminotransferase [Pedococcus cremeus]
MSSSAPPEVRVWVNGALVGADQPAVAALDHGVTVGDGAFETCKVEDGQVFAATRHAERLDRTLAGLGLPAADHAYIAEGIKAVLGAGEPLPFGRLRYSVTGGAGPLGSDRDSSPLTYIVTAGPQPRPPASAGVAVVPWVRNERSAVAGLKTTSYAENVVALAHAKQRGAIEALLANTRDELCEGTGSNVFVVRDGVLWTPPLESGCLAGVTRALTVEWCRADGLEVREEPMPLSVLEECDEVLLTSSTKDVLPVDRVVGLPGGTGERVLEPGPVGARAREVFGRQSALHLDP